MTCLYILYGNLIWPRVIYHIDLSMANFNLKFKIIVKMSVSCIVCSEPIRGRFPIKHSPL